MPKPTTATCIQQQLSARASGVRQRELSGKGGRVIPLDFFPGEWRTHLGAARAFADTIWCKARGSAAM